VDAHEVEMFLQELDAQGVPVGVAETLGRHAPDAKIVIRYTPVSPDRKVRVYAVAYSADGVADQQELRYATQATVLFNRPTVSVSGIDEHVPTVTLAPTVTKTEGFDEWVVFTPAPDAYGATVTDGEVWVEKADDATVHETWPVAVAPTHRVPQKAFASKMRYRWRNQSAEDAGDGRGWSAWSPYQTAAEIGAAVPPPPASDALTTFVYDAADSRAGIDRGVIVG
jgi:hypothetical protein